MDANLTDYAEVTKPPVSIKVTEPSAAQKCERFIAFYFGGGLYCVRAESVAEVIHALPVAVLPNSPRGILGITAIRGGVIAVINLNEFLNEEDVTAQAGSKMVILRSPENQTQLAIPADRMHKVVMLPESLSDNKNNLLRQVDHEGGRYKVIDTEKLCAEIAAHIIG